MSLQPIRILTSCGSMLSESQIRGLEADGIKTLHDFIIQDKSKVMSAAGLSLAEYESLEEGVLELILPKPARFANSSQFSLMSTGIKGLDEMLDGGLEGGEMLEIFGPVAAGKTQICLAISAQFLMSQHSVAYFDLKCNFSAKRLLHYCNGVREELRQITVIRPSNMMEMVEDLEEIRQEIVSHADDAFSNLKLIVFDSIPMILYPAVDGDVVSWRYYQEKFIEKVVQLSKLNDGIVIIFVNHSVNRRSDFGNGNPKALTLMTPEKPVVVKPALGSGYWSHKPNFRLQLCKDLNKDYHYNAVLRKSSRTACEQQFSFVINELGIQCKNNNY